MKKPASFQTSRTKPAAYRGPDAIAQSVQELLNVAAMANQRTGSAIYLPETFLTRW